LYWFSTAQDQALAEDASPAAESRTDARSQWLEQATTKRLFVTTSGNKPVTESLEFSTPTSIRARGPMKPDAQIKICDVQDRYDRRTIVTLLAEHAEIGQAPNMRARRAPSVTRGRSTAHYGVVEPIANNTTCLVSCLSTAES